MTAIELTLADVQRDKDAVHAWLRAHDLDPMETAPGVRIEGGTVTATVWLRNDQGERYVAWDEATGDRQAAHEVVTRELRAPLPAFLGRVTA